VDRSAVDRWLNFRVYQCYYPRCIQPIPPPDPVINPVNTTAHRPANYVYANTNTLSTFFHKMIIIIIIPIIIIIITIIMIF